MANSYVDDIKVKISEKYKPPARISMPISYSQRLTLNKQLQENRAVYDFGFERTVIEKMKEWREGKKDLKEERKQRLELARKEFNKKIEQEKLEKVEKAQAEAKLQEESCSTSTTSQNMFLNNSSTKESNPNQKQQNYVTKNGILMPIPVTNYNSHTDKVLNPTSFEYAALPVKMKPFNLSDFESDTSSPFDNMELKSINDLEELAQVLKSDKTSFQSNIYPNNYQPTYSSAGLTRNYNNFYSPAQAYQTNTYSQVNTNFNPAYSQYNNPYVTSQVPSYSNQLNGYNMYNNPLQVTSQAQLSYGNYNSHNTQLPIIQKSNCKSVPDLVKSLEEELGNTHLNDYKDPFYTTNNVPVPTRPKSTDSVYPKVKSKNAISPLDKLTSEQKHICQNVSLMGFPLERVVRVCQAMGCDQKKMVDHLLALSELLDLGFSEKLASEALIQNDNNRDKALDFLIS